MNTELSLRMLTQWKSSGCDSSDDRSKPNKIVVTPRGSSALTSKTSSWSAGLDSPNRQRATVLFDKDDGGQIMVSYDAPPPATRPRPDDTMATSTTAPADNEIGECERQRHALTETELQRQEEDTQLVVATSSFSSVASLKSELCGSKDEQVTKTRNRNQHGSAGVTTRPLYDKRAASVSTKQEMQLHRSVTSVVSSRRQSLGAPPSKKSTIHDQGAVGKVNTSVITESAAKIRDMKSRDTKSNIKKAETKLPSTSRSVSTSRRSSLMMATASSRAKRSENSANNGVVNNDEHQPATGSSASFAASLTSKITKLVKGGSKPAAGKTAETNNKRLSLDASTRPPRHGLMTPSASVTSRPGDNSDRKSTSRPSELSQSMNVGQRHSVTYIRGIGTGRGHSSGGSKIPAASLTKSLSTISLRAGEGAKNPVVNKAERNVTEQLRKDFTGGTAKKQDMDVQCATSPSPVLSPSSPELLRNSAAAAAAAQSRSYTDGRRKWTESKCTEDKFVVTSIYQLAKRVENKSTTLLGLRESNAGMNSMNDEDEQQQQQQQPLSSPADNLPEWKSADPYLASILRHLRATDQHLDEIHKALASSAADENTPPASEPEYSISSAV